MLKNKTIFKSIAVALIMFMMVAALSPSVGTVYAMLLDEGSCGNNLDWTLNGDSTAELVLSTVSRTGQMYDYSPDSPAPWTINYNDIITTIKIASGVNRIGSYAFANCTSLTSITYAGTMEKWNAITKGEGWDSNTGDYTITCSDGTIAKSDSGSGESGNDNPVQPPTQPSEGQPITGADNATGSTNVEYTVDQTGWTFSVPAAQEFTKENLILYGYASINPESGNDIISLPSGQTINMTFTAANFNNGVFELRNGSNSVIPYTIGRVSMVASEGGGNNEIIENITSNGCSVLTYMAGSSANTGVTNKLRFATTLENIKNAKVTGLHTDTLTFTVNVSGGTTGGGSESGGGSTTTPTLISFTIDSTSYQAEEGMTWAEWVDSEYNVDGYKTGVLGQDFCIAGGNGFSYTSGDSNVIATASSHYGTSYIVGKHIMLQNIPHTTPISQSEVITAMDYILGACSD